MTWRHDKQKLAPLSNQKTFKSSFMKAKYGVLLCGIKAVGEKSSITTLYRDREIHRGVKDLQSTTILIIL